MRERIYENIIGLVGRTPLVSISKLAGSRNARIAAKLEQYNPTGSVKDRIVLNMLEDAEKRGYLKPGSIIIEPTSGNTGIGLASFCCLKGWASTSPPGASPCRTDPSSWRGSACSRRCACRSPRNRCFRARIPPWKGRWNISLRAPSDKSDIHKAIHMDFAPALSRSGACSLPVEDGYFKWMLRIIAA